MLEDTGTDYTGVEGSVTFCVQKDVDGTAAPTSVNIGTMPCIQNAKVHFATAVTTPNEDAVAYFGAALSNGPDRNGVTVPQEDLMINQFVAGDKLAENTKTVALALSNDDGNGSDPT